MDMQRIPPAEPGAPAGMEEHQGEAVGEPCSRGCGLMLSTTSRMSEAVPVPVCNDLVAFADGELDAERAAAFRAHLASCEACQAGLVEAMQLSARLSELKPRTRT